MLDNGFFMCSSGSSMTLQLCDPTNRQETFNSLIVSPAQFSVFDGVRRWCEVWNQHSRTRHNVVIVQFKKTLFMSVCVCVCALMCVRACVCVGWACVEGGVSTLCDIPHSIKWLHSFWWRDMWMASLLLMVWWPTHQILSHQSNILCQTNRSVIQGKFLGWETLLFQLCTEGFSKPTLFYSFIGQINDC